MEGYKSFSIFRRKLRSTKSVWCQYPRDYKVIFGSRWVI